MADEGWVTVADISESVGASEYSIRLALANLGIQGKTDMSDRRRTIYPPGSTEKVRKWLEEH